MSNPHYKAALDSYSSISSAEEIQALGHYFDSLIQAALALAYEQRTANLLAYRPIGRPSPIEIEALDKMIRERLSL